MRREPENQFSLTRAASTTSGRARKQFLISPTPVPPTQLLTLVLIAGVCLSTPHAPASASGPEGSHTGAPGETTCTACHTPVVARAGSISLSGVPLAYNPGVTYPLTVTVNDTGNKFGFQLAALTSAGAQAGAFVDTTTNTQQVPGTVLGNPRQYIEHNFWFAATATKSWKFNWTAPGSSAGPVSFYLAGLRADNTAATNNDTTYSTTQTSLDHLQVAIARSGPNVVLTWTGGKLQYVDKLANGGTVWTNVPGSPTSPYTTNALQARRFYRAAYP